MISFLQIKCYMIGMLHSDNEASGLPFVEMLDVYTNSLDGEKPSGETFLSFLQGAMQTCNSNYLPFLQKIESFIRLSERSSVNNGKLNPLDFNKLIGDHTVPYTTPVPYYFENPPFLDMYKVTCSGSTMFDTQS